MYKFTRFLSVFFIGLLVVSGDVFGAGYTCPTYKKYTGCEEGYYLTSTSSSTACYPTPKTANACRPCSVYGADYICDGGTSCPHKNEITCEPGYFLEAGATYCRSCNGSGYCPGGTFEPSDTKDQGIESCPTAYNRAYPAAKSINDCFAMVGAGKYVKNSYDSTPTNCAAGSYKEQHMVYYGDTSTCDVCASNSYSDSGAGSCTSCASGYTNSGSTASSHAGEESCKITCSPGTYVATVNGSCVSVDDGYWGAGGQISQGTTGGRTPCDVNYRDGGPATSEEGCVMDVAAGSHVATSGGAAVLCANWSYKGAHTVNYGSTSSCTSCPTLTSGWTKGTGTGWTSYSSCYQTKEVGGYCSAGSLKQTASSASSWGSTQIDEPLEAESGAYVNGTTCTRCSGAEYSAGGTVTSCTSCPAQTSGWTRATGTGWTSYSSCYQTKEVGGYCTAGSLKQTASSPSTWGTTTIGTALLAEPGAYVSGQTCSVCSGAKYSAGGTATSCKACPTATSGWSLGTGIGWESYSQCYQIKEVGGYCSAGTLKKVASSASSWSSSTTVLVALMAEPGAYVSGQTCKQCNGAEYSAGGNASSCKACPAETSGWTLGTGTGWSSYSECYQTKEVGGYCTAGSLKQNANSASTWGSTTVGTALRAEPGAYVSGQKCVQCNGAEYSAGGTVKTCKACPAETDGWTLGTGVGWTSYSSCYQTKDVGGNCSAGSLKQNASSASAWGATTEGDPLQAKPGAFVDGDTCTVCGSNTYSLGGAVDSCTSCPASYTTTGTALTNHDQKADCKITCNAGTRVVSANAACTTPSGSWYTDRHTVSAGSTSASYVESCLTGYNTPNTTVATDHDAESDCKISCAAGTQIVSVNATSCTTPTGNWYVGAHSVSQGQTSVVKSCLQNYKISGTNAANHDAENDCKISCDGGSYIATARDTYCTQVGVGNWAAASTVSQGAKGVFNACSDGLTTIGYGAGADEAGDCGRILHLGDSKIYLRSDKKTPTALNVGIDGQVFYGNMDTEARGTLRIKSGSTTYSVYDDSML